VDLPEIIRDRLAQFDRRRRLIAVLRGLAESLWILGVEVLVIALLEWRMRPGLSGRVWLSALGYLLAFAWLLYRTGAPLFRRSAMGACARDYEASAKGHFQERILSAVEMAESPPPGVSVWMVQRTIELASEEIGLVAAASLVDPAPARRAWKRAAAVALLIGLSCLWPSFLTRARLAFYPFASAASLPDLRLAVTPGNCRIKLGAPLDLMVSAEREFDQAKARLVWDDGFQESVLTSRSTTNASALHLPVVTRGFHYSVVAGEAESPVFTVKVDAPPRIRKMQLWIEPPAYARQTNQVVDGGSASFLMGSHVRLRIETTAERLTSAELLVEGFPARRLLPESDTWVLSLQPSNTIAYQLRLVGENSLITEAGQKWTLQPLPDEPPTARLEVPGTESGLVGMDEVLRLLGQANDDVGLKRVDLVVLNREAIADHKTLFPVRNDSALDNTSTTREVKTATNYKLADLNGLTGDELQFQVVATDWLDQTTRSDPILVTIGAVDKALEARMAERIKQLASAVEGQLEYLKQTRTSWLSIGRNYQQDDPQAQGTTLVLLNSRLSEWSHAVDLIGGQLVSESETNNLSETRFLYRLGTSLSAWGQQQREVLSHHCASLDPGDGRNLLDTFNNGRELFSHALIGLEQFRRVLIVLQGALETDVLASRCESAQGRYKRGLPILFGENNTIAPLTATASGLRAVFFEGIQLNGKVIERKIDNPRFDNYAPANRRDEWSCRYQGDINIPESGDWTLACVADDGVRLIIDDRSVLPADAWSAHPANQYRADLKLASGWRPITIEFFQGSGESKLQLLAAKKGQPLQEVPISWLRPSSARPREPVAPDDPLLRSFVRDGLRDRVKSGLALPTAIPRAVATFTNAVQNENLTRRTDQELPVGEALSVNLDSFANWKPADTQKAEAQADDLTAFSREAQRMLREELEKYRWRYEGSAALKPVQNALEELRQINQELRQQPHNPSPRRSEQEQAKLDMAKAWERELGLATANATRQFFETARQKDVTLAERALALQASTQAEEQLQPAESKLEEAFNERLNKNDLAGKIDERLNEIERRYRELNDLQERINREEIAAEARRAYPSARAFAKAQTASTDDRLPDKYTEMKQAVSRVEQAQEVAGDYQDANRLAVLAGASPQDAKGKETAQALRELANRTDNNLPSFAKSIPPPLQNQTEALETLAASGPTSASLLAKPRLAMELEAARLFRGGQPKIAVAYELLGEDTGELLASPNRLTAAALRPLAARATALAGDQGEDARQAEIQAAEARRSQLARTFPNAVEPLADKLDSLSELAKQAAGDAPKQPRLKEELGATASLASRPNDWTESSIPAEVAAGAAQESLEGIQRAPKQWESYDEAARILTDAARQIRMDSAVGQLADLDPYALPQTTATPPSRSATSASTSGATAKMDGQAGQIGNPPAPRGIDLAEWARLNDQLRRAIRSSGIEHFSEEQQLAIRAYFEKLSSTAIDPTKSLPVYAPHSNPP